MLPLLLTGTHLLMGSPLLLLGPEAGDLADPALSLSVLLLLLRRWHATVAMAAMAKCPVRVGQRLVIEDVRFAHRSTAGRRAVLTMTTRAVFRCQTLWG